MKTHKLMHLFCVVVALTLFAAACGDDDTDSADSDGGVDGDASTGDDGSGTDGGASEVDDGDAPTETTDVTVAVVSPSCVVFYPLFAADGEGYFADEGLDVDVVSVDGSSGALGALSSGQAQIGGPGPGPLLLARENGEDLVHFYNLFARNAIGMYVVEDSDIETVEDLADVQIGVGTADGVEVSFARGVLADIGVTDPDFLPVGDGGLAFAAIDRGDIEVYIGGPPDVATIRARGQEMRNIVPPEYLWSFGNGFAAQRTYIEENPGVIEGFGRALTRGLLWANENPEAAIEHCMSVNPEEAQDEDLATALLATMQESFTPFEGDAYGYFPPASWERYEDSMMESGELTDPIDDLDQAYTNEFVDAFNAG